MTDATLTQMERVGPLVQVKRSCWGCRYLEGAAYRCQGDSGTDYYCRHPGAPRTSPSAMHVGDCSTDTPEWCPAITPETLQAENERLRATDPAAEAVNVCQSSDGSIRSISNLVLAGSAFVAKFGREPASPSDCAWLNGYDAALEGTSPTPDHSCPDCYGSGTIQEPDEEGPNAHPVDMDCPRCKGTGTTQKLGDRNE